MREEFDANDYYMVNDFAYILTRFNISVDDTHTTATACLNCNSFGCYFSMLLDNTDLEDIVSEAMAHWNRVHS